MERRTFLKATGVIGLNTVIGWGQSPAQQRRSADFLKEKTSDRMLFSRPHDLPRKCIPRRRSPRYRSTFVSAAGPLVPASKKPGKVAATFPAQA